MEKAKEKRSKQFVDNERESPSQQKEGRKSGARRYDTSPLVAVRKAPKKRKGGVRHSHAYRRGRGGEVRKGAKRRDRLVRKDNYFWNCENHRDERKKKKRQEEGFGKGSVNVLSLRLELRGFCSYQDLCRTKRSGGGATA